MELKRKLYRETKEQIENLKQRLDFLKNFERSFTLEVPLTVAIYQNERRIKVGFPTTGERFEEWEKPDNIQQWLLANIPEF